MPVPAEAQQALGVLQRCFGDALVGVYLHGSAVGGGLRPFSDVDVMAVIEGAMGTATRRKLLAELMQVSGRYPPRPGDPRPLELMVFERAEMQGPSYPARCAFLYGEWLRAECEAGMVPAPASEPDFTLMVAQARWQSQALFGLPAANLLPVIADDEIRRAIVHALPGLLASLRGDERNVLLTLARMWRTLATREFVPKDVAAQWAIERLSAEGAVLLVVARDAYLGLAEDDWQGCEPRVQQLADALARQITALV